MWKRLNFNKLNGSMPMPWGTLSVAGFVLLVHILSFTTSVNLEEMLQYRRSDIWDGGIWQLLTGHLVHWNVEHLIVDLAVFIGIGSFVENRSRKRWFFLMFCASFMISGTVFVYRPEIECYRGLSGVDMALAAFWIIDSFLQSRKQGNRFDEIVWGVAIIGIVAKPIAEIMIGHPIFVQDLGRGVVGMPVSHIVGVVVGIPVALILRWRPCFRKAPERF